MLDPVKLQTVSNHPVHIINEDGRLSPSALIPFCEFGGNMSSMGLKTDQFDIPVCRSFKAKILNDQLCYEVDLDKYKNQDSIDKDLKLGLAFFMDYNEDRQVSLNETTNKIQGNVSFGSRYDGSFDDKDAFIFLNSIGKYYYYYLSSYACNYVN